MEGQRYTPSSIPELTEQRAPFGYVEYRKYRAERPSEWKSDESLRWFIRTHRLKLVEAEAVGLWRKQIVVHPKKFARASRQILVAGAAKMLGGL
jgi:hypothetical protein